MTTYTTIHDFYTLDEACAAKNTLLVEFDKVLDAELIKEARKQRQIGKSGARQKVVKDILDIWQIIDKEAAGKLSTIFVAADLNRVPPISAEGANLQLLISAVLKLQEQQQHQQAQTTALIQEATKTSKTVGVISNSVGVISNTLIQINRRLDKGTEAVTALNASMGAPSPASFHSPAYTPSRSLPLQPIGRKRQHDDSIIEEDLGVSPFLTDATSVKTNDKNKKRRKCHTPTAALSSPDDATGNAASDATGNAAGNPVQCRK